MMKQKIPLTKTRLSKWIFGNDDEKTDFVLRCQKFRHSILDKIALLVSKTCDEEFYITLLPALIWFGSPELGRLLCLTIPLGFSIGNMLKNYFSIPRPCSTKVWKGRNVNENEYAFPSTHALQSTSLPIAVSIWYASQIDYAGLSPLIKLGWGAGIAAWVALISFSRMYLGVHYLPDVLSGIAVGGAIGTASGLLFKSINTAMVNADTPVLLAAALFYIILGLIHPLYYTSNRKGWNLQISNNCYMVSLTLIPVALGSLIAHGVSKGIEFPRASPLPIFAKRLGLGLVIFLITYFGGKVLITQVLKKTLALFGIPWFEIPKAENMTLKPKTTESTNGSTNGIHVEEKDPKKLAEEKILEDLNRARNEKFVMGLFSPRGIQLKAVIKVLQYLTVTVIAVLCPKFVFEPLGI
jgi:membrane-associated phospholipid phosphatase